jgi:hypothetical protein
LYLNTYNLSTKSHLYTDNLCPELIHIHRAEELAAADPGGPAASAAVERGESLLILAARYWRSKESLAEGGALRTSCGELARLGRAEGFVKVCLACAANFPPTGERHSYYYHYYRLCCCSCYCCLFYTATHSTTTAAGIALVIVQIVLLLLLPAEEKCEAKCTVM